MKCRTPSPVAAAPAKPARSRRVNGRRETTAPWDKIVEMDAGEGSLSLSGGDFAFAPADDTNRESEIN